MYLTRHCCSVDSAQCFHGFSGHLRNTPRSPWVPMSNLEYSNIVDGLPSRCCPAATTNTFAADVPGVELIAEPPMFAVFTLTAVHFLSSHSLSATPVALHCASALRASVLLSITAAEESENTQNDSRSFLSCDKFLYYNFYCLVNQEEHFFFFCIPCIGPNPV